MATIEQALAAAWEHCRAGRLQEAYALCRRILAADEGQAGAWHLAGLIAQRSPQRDVGRTYLQRAATLAPHVARYHLDWGIALQLARNFAPAEACYRRVLELEPQSAQAQVNLGAVLNEVGRYDEAERILQAAVRLQPQDPLAHFNLGPVYQSLGQLPQAIAAFEKALELQPHDAEAHSALLTMLLYRPGITPAELQAAHRAFQRRHAAPFRAQWMPHHNDRDPQRRLRVGFLSALFWENPAGWLLLPVLEALRPHAELVAYDCAAVRDAGTARAGAAVHQWRDITALSDDDVARQIRDDQIDILFDVNGHLSHNRLLILARKPAPIQITWLAYEGTTGLEAIDYILADRQMLPAGAEHFYVERVLRMPDAYVCHRPCRELPAVGPLPALREGCVTFGSFSGPPKVGRDVVRVWGQILRRVERSRLILKKTGFDNRTIQQRFQDWFADEGIAADRLEFAGMTPLPEAWAEYNRVDIALDPFPFSGSLTTCDALWMGVPVITWPGESFAGRHSLTHLATLGMTETIARDAEHYVDLTVELAGDLPRLAALRAGLRPRMEASPLGDAPRFAQNLATLLREVWQQWCAATR